MKTFVNKGKRHAIQYTYHKSNTVSVYVYSTFHKKNNTIKVHLEVDGDFVGTFKGKQHLSSVHK